MTRPTPPVETEGQLGADLLAAYCLARGDLVEVELLVVEQIGAMGPTPMLRPRIIEGPVAGATSAILLIGGRTSDVRIPWSAIATVRNAPTPHPAL